MSSQEAPGSLNATGYDGADISSVTVDSVPRTGASPHQRVEESVFVSRERLNECPEELSIPHADAISAFRGTDLIYTTPIREPSRTRVPTNSPILEPSSGLMPTCLEGVYDERDIARLFWTCAGGSEAALRNRAFLAMNEARVVQEDTPVEVFNSVSALARLYYTMRRDRRDQRWPTAKQFMRAWRRIATRYVRDHWTLEGERAYPHNLPISYVPIPTEADIVFSSGFFGNCRKPAWLERYNAMGFGVAQAYAAEVSEAKDDEIDSRFGTHLDDCVVQGEDFVVQSRDRDVVGLTFWACFHISVLSYALGDFLYMIFFKKSVDVRALYPFFGAMFAILLVRSSEVPRLATWWRIRRACGLTICCVCFLAMFHALGVAYSSNDAGDGPWQFNVRRAVNLKCAFFAFWLVYYGWLPFEACFLAIPAICDSAIEMWQAGGMDWQDNAFNVQNCYTAQWKFRCVSYPIALFLTTCICTAISGLWALVFHFVGTQLGKAFSSNDAGDGPYWPVQGPDPSCDMLTVGLDESPCYFLVGNIYALLYDSNPNVLKEEPVQWTGFFLGLFSMRDLFYGVLSACHLWLLLMLPYDYWEAVSGMKGKKGWFPPYVWHSVLRTCTERMNYDTFWAAKWSLILGIPNGLRFGISTYLPSLETSIEHMSLGVGFASWYWLYVVLCLVSWCYLDRWYWRNRRFLRLLIEMRDELTVQAFESPLGDSFEYVKGVYLKYHDLLSVHLPGLDRNKTLKRLEALGVFVSRLSRLRDARDFFESLVSLVHGLFDTAVSELLIRELEKIWKEPEEGDNSMSIQAVDWETCKSKVKSWKDLFESPFATKLHKFLALCSFTGVLSYMGVKLNPERFSSYYTSTKMHEQNSVSIYLQLLDNAVFIIERLGDFLSSWKISSLLYSDSEAVRLDAEFAFIEGNFARYKAGGLERETMEIDGRVVPKLTDVEFRMRVFALLDAMRLKNLKFKERWLHSPERTVFERKLARLEKFHSEIIAGINAKIMRPAPFAISLSGYTGQGKSGIVTMLSKVFCKAHGIDYYERLVVNINSKDKYQSEVKNSHLGVVLDDFANTKAEFTQESPTNIVIDIVNNVRKYVLKADVDEKGVVQWNNLFLIATTNVPSLDVGSYSNEPASVLRRFDFHVSMRVRPEFAKPRSSVDEILVLDPEKMRGALIQDAWEFDVFKIVVNKPRPERNEHNPGIHPCQPVFVIATGVTKDGAPPKPLRGIGVDELCYLLGVTCAEHCAQQNEFVCRLEELASAPLCKHYTLAARCEQCLEASALEVQGRDETWLGSVFETGVPNLRSRIRLRDRWELFKTDMSDLSEWGCGKWTYLKSWCVTQLLIRFISASWDLYVIMTSWLFDTWKKGVEEKCFIYALSAGYSFKLSLFLIAGGYALLMFGCALVLPVSILWSFRFSFYWTWRIGFSFAAISAAGRTSLIINYAFKRICDEKIQSVRRAINTRILVASGIACAMLTGLLFLRSKLGGGKDPGLEIQGGYYSVPQVDKIQKRDIWVKSERFCSLPLGAKARNMRLEDLANVLSKAQVSIEAYCGTAIRRTNGLFISTNFLLAPYHLLLTKQGYAEKLRVSTAAPDQIGCHFTIRIGPENVKRVGEMDLAVIYTAKGGPRRDLFDLGVFPEKVVNVSLGITELYRDPDTGEVWEHKYNATPGVYTDNTREEVELRGSFPSFSYMRPSITFNGLCGATLLAKIGGGPCVVGFHQLGKDGAHLGVACAISEPLIRAAYEELIKRDIVHVAAKPMLREPYVPNCVDLSPPLVIGDTVDPKSVTNRLPPGSCLISLGKHNQPRRGVRSQVELTPIAESVAEICGTPISHGPPEGLRSLDAWYDNLEPSTGSYQFEWKYLRLAYRDMRDQILGAMRANKDILGPIAPYTYDVVTSGVAGVKGVNALKLTTSMGWPWCKSKNQFMSRGDPVLPEYPDGVIDFDDPKIMEDIEWCKNEYREGRRCGLVFRACLKDEPTKIGKKKVRLFTSSNIILSVLCRQYFLPIARIIAQYPLLFYTAVGMNCYSTDWCLVRGLIAIFGAERVFAGDFKKYDKRLEYQAQILMWVLLRDCGEILGYPEEALRIMNGIMEDIARPIWETNGEFLIKETDNSSGHDMTVVINGLANWLQMGYSFYKKVPDFLEPEMFQNRVALYFSTVMPELDWSFMEELDKEPLLPQLSGRFSKYVSLITLGDDNALGVSEKAKWFDHIAVSDALSEVGLDYTDADKNTPTVGFQGIDNISFLKRKFVMHEDIGRIVAPIEEASIWKSLFCWKKTSEVPWEQHCADQINGALREFALYGEEVFERRRAEFVKIAEKHDIMHYFPMNKPFTYRELLGWYADM